MAEGGSEGAMVGMEKGVEWDSSGIVVGSGVVLSFY